jgi:REP-associated tyrosine transposase
MSVRMARLLRPRIIELTQHVIQRGNNRSDIFRSPQDYDLFLACIAEACCLHQLTVNAYVLMTNHVHLMLTPHAPDAISLAMQTIGRRYVYCFNHRYERTGGLFEGRYRSIIDSERYWLRCMRYVELNPVRAGLVQHPHHYRWSSHRAHALGITDQLLVLHPLYLALGDSPVGRQLAWRELCREALASDELAELRRALHRGSGVRHCDRVDGALTPVTNGRGV